MAWLPGGTFTMGEKKDRVTVAGFCLDVTEVTVAAYASCASCTPAATTVDWPGISEDDRRFFNSFCNGNRPDRRDHPINCVDWNQADNFCAAGGKRLPTEQEWEYAARSGGRAQTYPWGNGPPGALLLNACGSECVAMMARLGRPDWKGMYSGDDGWEATAPVGSFPNGATAQGVRDMAGNVWEWTSSAYDADRRVIRGASWDIGDPSNVRSAFRFGAPFHRSAHLGLRCAR